MYQRAFVIVSDDSYFPGLWALLNSIHAYHGRELRVFVVGFKLRPDFRDTLRQHPLASAITFINSRELAYRPAGAWEVKQCVLSHLTGKVQTACLMDADLVLLSRLDDAFSLAENGKIVSSRDGQRLRTYGEVDRIYSDDLPGVTLPYFNSGFLCLDLVKNWDVVALWEFTSRFAGYSPGGGEPFRFPGHGDQGLLNAVVAMQKKQADLELLPEENWCNSSGWTEVETVQIQRVDGPRLDVVNRRLQSPQRLLHSSGPKWWTTAGRDHFRKSGDVLNCFEHFENLCRIADIEIPEYASAATELRFSGLPWGPGESISGPGSSLDATRHVREWLEGLLNRFHARSFLDIPCGDFHWMKQVQFNGVEYIGADVVSAIVEQNRVRYPDRRFEHLDLIRGPLPQTDIVFVRDCLVHLPFREIFQALKTIVDSGAEWLIATQFPGRRNQDIEIGDWHPLDLTAAPFSLPDPTEVASEGCDAYGGAYADKSLAVWKVAEIAAAEERNSREWQYG